MNRYYSSIKKQLVREFGNENEALASVYDFVINPSNGNIMAVLVLSPLSFSQQNIVLPQDIMKWSKNLYIKDESDICNINDIIRLRHVKEGYFNLIDCSVYTESEVYLGQVFDYMFDDNIFTVTKLIVGDSKFFGLFKNEKMRISRDQIITVTSDKIIVKDLKIKEPVKEESVYSFEPVAG